MVRLVVLMFPSTHSSVLRISVLVVAGKDGELLVFGEERVERASSSNGESVSSYRILV
jgi:hypothetical protein